MSDQQLDKPEETPEQPEKPPELEKERLEIKLKEVEDSVRIPGAVQEGAQLREQIREAMQEGDYRRRPLGIRDTPIERIAIDGPVKELPEEARRQVVKDLEVMRDIQDMRARGLSREEIYKMGGEYRRIHQRYFEPHVDNIKGTEYDGRVLVDAGRTHAAYAAELRFTELPVNTERLEVGENIRLKHRFEREAPDAPLYRRNPSRLEFMNRFEQAIGEAEGFARVKAKTLSENPHAARGYFSELARAYRVHEAGLNVEALDKNVETRAGRTDIDILARRKDGSYIWIENKDVKDISNTEDFRDKIDKMAAGLKEGVEIEPGRTIKIDKAVFVNQGHISREAMEYARRHNIEIQEKMAAGKKFREYIAGV
ncbi:MAG: hypothetical protein D6681_23035 [Calditrichaeota bacterium]|nr:MAG: hypothetical protein D6681_23035 [Calditrichota bacterium]